MTPVDRNPGIFGFMKAHRHPTGCAVVMSKIEDDEFVVIYWVKKLIRNAVPFMSSIFDADDKANIEREYLLYLKDPLPPVTPDRQKKKVYDWEDSFICSENYCDPLSWEECKKFSSHVWKELGIKKKCPVLIDNRKFNTAISLSGEIFLPKDKDFRNKPLLLHELAHEITPQFVNHGPLFVKNVIDLYSRFLGIDKTYMENSARDFDVCFDNKLWI
jgi:hypothetical protein